MAIYEQSRHALAQFQAPRLVSGSNPHSRLFVASFDGTGNDKYKDPEHITNIGILDDQVQTAKNNDVKNIRGYYVPGVGTQDNAFTQAIDGGLGYSYGPRMEEMYLRFILQARRWHDENPHAEISILSTGFSRGAVTAAMFTRMVDERGIQDPEGMQIDYGPAGEVRQLTATRPPLAPPGRTAQAVALLDPVATGDMNLRDVRLPPSVVSGLQISARDERRDAFPVKDILDPGRSRDGRFLDLVNPGAHSDIGGSYRLDGLAVRNGNLLSAYVNSLGDTPFAQARTVPGAPEMNVIHRSEQHQAFYTTALASVLGQRVHVKELAGTAWSLNRTDAEPLDAALRARYPLRAVPLPAERTDPSLPAFFQQRPSAPAPAPQIESWTPLLLNAPHASLRRDAAAPAAQDRAPDREQVAGAGQPAPMRWNPLFLAATDAALRNDGDGVLAAGRAYAQSEDGQAWLRSGQQANQALALQQEQERQLQQQRALEAQQQAPVHAAPVMRLG
ncbi:T6SS phospholipase effector Tle1-like catalytic domain-containing protein [Xanthomonas theicola]|uniref:phospholipase effector Tle1 domain-containing protein n=1 Tax=Xanthomonas theicola TaxID=56464 RepID=UPI001FE79DB3|nr:DUF2235 domain-containing protein [Xanthomonas theicola]